MVFNPDYEALVKEIDKDAREEKIRKSNIRRFLRGEKMRSKPVDSLSHYSRSDYAGTVSSEQLKELTVPAS